MPELISLQKAIGLLSLGVVYRDYIASDIADKEKFIVTLIATLSRRTPKFSSNSSLVNTVAEDRYKKCLACDFYYKYSEHDYYVYLKYVSQINQ